MNLLLDRLLSFQLHYPGLAGIGFALIKGIAIIGLAWGLSVLLRDRSAAARCWVWRLSFAALLLLALWSSRPSWLDRVKLEIEVAQPSEYFQDEPIASARLSQSGSSIVEAASNAALSQRKTESDSSPLVLAKEPRLAVAARHLARFAGQHLGSFLLAISGVLLVCRMMRSWLALKRLRRSSKLAADLIQQRCDLLAAEGGLRSLPQVRISGEMDSPLVSGIWRPIIWLPAEAAEWSRAQLEAAIHHELAHIVRHDLAWQWLASVAVCIWWWNPLMRPALSRLQAETEQAADEQVVAGTMPPADYAEALVRIAAGMVPAQRAVAGIPMLGVSALERRVRELLRNHPWRKRMGLFAQAMLASLAVIASGLVLVSCKAKPPEHVSLAKLVAGVRITGGGGGSGPAFQEYLIDFYGTIIETIESKEMRRRALDRVRALHPDFKETEVGIQVVQKKGAAVFEVTATGAEPKYTQTFLDALLDEFIAFRHQIREQQRNKALTTLAEDVVRRERDLGDQQDRVSAFEKTTNSALLAGEHNEAQSALAAVKNEIRLGRQRLAEIDHALANIGAAMTELERSASMSRKGGQDQRSPSRTEAEYLNLRQALLKSKLEAKLQAPPAAEPSSPDQESPSVLQEQMLKLLEQEIAKELQIEKDGAEKRIASQEKEVAGLVDAALQAGAKIAAHQKLIDNLAQKKRSYDEVLDLVRRFTASEDMTSDYVVIMERASAAVQRPAGWFGR